MSSNKQTVRRYVAGRIPHYATNVSESESDDEQVEQFVTKNIDLDKKLTLVEKSPPTHRVRAPTRTVDSEEDDDEDEVEHRHAAILRRRAREEEELLGSGSEEEDDDKGEDGDSDDDDDDDESDEEDEDYTDDEDDTGPQLKPVFIAKKYREAVIEENIESTKDIEIKQRDERRKEALRIIEEETKREIVDESKTEEEEHFMESMAACNDDDEDEEIEYEAWKIRELKRIKREKEEREAEIKEKAEIERLRNLTEEERLEELKKRPKVITNKASKGKYKYLQKYYHRGAFYMDQEETILKRNYAEPTLEDQFDKTTLPKIMQVKNFGRSGRTKYTHLVDQDTTKFDSPWATENATTTKFATIAGGMKQCFDRPTKKRKH